MSGQHTQDIELRSELAGDGDDTVVLANEAWLNGGAPSSGMWSWVRERTPRLSLVVRRRLTLRSSTSERRVWQLMRGLPSRLSDWVLSHPVVWGVGSAVVLVLLGFALDLPPIVVITAGTAMGVLNILHAKRRGYCPLPAEPGSHPERVDGEQPLRRLSPD
jgi:hypothetical protein